MLIVRTTLQVHLCFSLLSVSCCKQCFLIACSQAHIVSSVRTHSTVIPEMESFVQVSSHKNYNSSSPLILLCFSSCSVQSVTVMTTMQHVTAPMETVCATMLECLEQDVLSRSLVTHTAFILVLITVPVVRCTTGPARQWCASPVAIGTTCILLLLDRTYAYYFAIRHSIVP